MIRACGLSFYRIGDSQKKREPMMSRLGPNFGIREVKYIGLANLELLK